MGTVTRLLEDDPRTVWAALTDPEALPRWIDRHAGDLEVGRVDPQWPEPGSCLHYAAGGSVPGHPVSVRVTGSEAGVHLALAVSRPAAPGCTTVVVDLQDAPLRRTAIRLARRPPWARRAGHGSVYDPRGERSLDRLTTQMRRRGPALTPPPWRT